MLRIETECDGRVTRLRLSGRIQRTDIDYIRAQWNNSIPHRILDLSEVTLVDFEVIRFLINCQAEGIELAQYPSYVGEWIVRERAEAEHPGPSSDG